MKTSLTTAAIALIAITVALALQSCAFTVNPDGSKSGTLDGPGVLRAIEILNAK